MAILEFTIKNKIFDYEEDYLKIRLYGDHQIKWLGGYDYICNCCAGSFVSTLDTTQEVLEDHQNYFKKLRRLYEAGIYKRIE